MNDDAQLISLQKLYTQKDFSAIVEYAEKNKDNINKNWVTFTLIGMAYFYKNQYAQSIIYQNKSIEIQANSLNTHNLGLILGATGKKQKAIKAFNECIKLGINDPTLFANIIDFCRKSNFTDDALKVANLMVNKFPNNHNSYFNLGLIYDDLGNHTQAIKYYEKCLTIDSSYINAMNNLGNCYSSLRKVDLAEDKYREALTIDDNNIPILYNYISFLIRMGRNKEAKEKIRDGIKINKHFPLFYTALKQTKTFNKGDKDIKLMEKILSDNRLDATGKSELSFALAKAYEDIKDYKSSATSLSEANSLKYQQLTFNKELTFHTFDKIISFYNKRFYKKHLNKGFKNSKSIFVIGLPRCGSTLIEQILSSHSKVRGLGELPNFSNEMFNLGVGRYDINEIEHVDISFFHSLGKNYIKSIKENYKIDNFFVDKALLFDKIGFIKLALPDAKIIHCKRIRNDQILSIYKNKFEKDFHAYAYNENLLNQYYDYYEKLIEHWDKILGSDLVTINYEDIIENPEKEIKRMLKYINLDWEDSCLEFHKNNRFVNTISSLQVKKPLYKDSINSWKNYENYLPNLFKNK